MRQPKAKESKILTVKDENIFFSVIEEHLEQEGFELLDTFPPLARGLSTAELT